ncbi:hypothetical protein [Caulobacter sp. 1776]|uniref:hypothetical protein n=1 Tax=Caulobacter sp. 1776 TaxID=3156420 RepID=UPI003396DD12
MQFVLVGEIHGTNEAPQILSDLLCAAKVTRRPVVVALEQPESAQADIDRFLASDGREKAASVFKTSAIWRQPIPDGRSSQAYFELFQRLRVAKAGGYRISVVAFQPSLSGAMPPQSDYNRLMAERLLAASKARRNALTLVLVGNVHASKAAIKSGDTTIVPTGAWLPANKTLSLLVRNGGGLAWNCWGKDNCGPHPTGNEPPRPRAVRYELPIREGYDGEIDLGAPTTPSPPVAPAPD